LVQARRRRVRAFFATTRERGVAEPRLEDWLDKAMDQVVASATT
jgi:hypothetical protein